VAWYYWEATLNLSDFVLEQGKEQPNDNTVENQSEAGGYPMFLGWEPEAAGQFVGGGGGEDDEEGDGQKSSGIEHMCIHVAQEKKS